MCLLSLYFSFPSFLSLSLSFPPPLYSLSLPLSHPRKYFPLLFRSCLSSRESKRTRETTAIDFLRTGKNRKSSLRRTNERKSLFPRKCRRKKRSELYLITGKKKRGRKKKNFLYGVEEGSAVYSGGCLFVRVKQEKTLYCLRDGGR